MRVLLRSTQTGLYCAGSDGWAASENRALDFTSVPQAARFAYHEHMPQAEIVLRSEVLPEEVVVPMIPEWCGLACLHP